MTTAKHMFLKLINGSKESECQQFVDRVSYKYTPAALTKVFI